METETTNSFPLKKQIACNLVLLACAGALCWLEFSLFSGIFSFGSISLITYISVYGLCRMFLGKREEKIPDWISLLIAAVIMAIALAMLLYDIFCLHRWRTIFQLGLLLMVICFLAADELKHRLTNEHFGSGAVAVCGLLILLSVFLTAQICGIVTHFDAEKQLSAQGCTEITYRGDVFPRTLTFAGGEYMNDYGRPEQYECNMYLFTMKRDGDYRAVLISPIGGDIMEEERLADLDHNAYYWPEYRELYMKEQDAAAFTLSDGIVISRWQFSGDDTTDYYRLPDGTTLLEAFVYGLEDIWGDVPDFHALPESVQQKILEHYADSPADSELMDTLERAYAASQTDPDFTAWYYYHTISAAAQNDRLFYCNTVTEIPEQWPGFSTTFQIFDRRDGSLVDPLSLFTVDRDTLAQRLLGEEEDTIRNRFDPALLQFWDGMLTMEIPNYQDYAVRCYSWEYDELTDILQPWAVPEINNYS